LSTPRISGPSPEIWINNMGLNSRRRDLSSDNSVIFLALVVLELSTIRRAERVVVKGFRALVAEAKKRVTQR